MKKMLFLALTLFLGTVAFAAQEKPIAEGQLPTVIKTFITQNFAQEKIAAAMYEQELFDKEYKIILTDGTKLEFDKQGNCKEVKSKGTFVPQQIFPQKIRQYLSTHYVNQPVVEYTKEKRGYEVKLKNGIELVFNKQGEFIRFD